MTEDTLWHYTNVDACQSILKSNELRLTNVWTYRSRSDTEADWEEFKHGLDIYSKTQYGKSARKVWSNLNEIVQLYSPFVMCFSNSNKNDTLLDERPGNFGVCLGFSLKEFFYLFHKYLHFNFKNGSVTYELKLSKCVYDEKTKNAI